MGIVLYNERMLAAAVSGIFFIIILAVYSLSSKNAHVYINMEVATFKRQLQDHLFRGDEEEFIQTRI